MMRLRAEIERGNLEDPNADWIYDDKGSYERTLISNKKNGYVLEVLKLTRQNLQPIYIVTGDIPVARRDSGFITGEIVGIRHCSVDCVHEHGYQRDIHPKCEMHSEGELKEELSELIRIVKKYAERFRKFRLE